MCVRVWVCECNKILLCLYEGLSVESDTDAVGQLDNGHTGVTGAGHRAAQRRAVKSSSVRSYQAAHITTDAAEHCRTRRLPARRHLYHSFRRSHLYYYFSFTHCYTSTAAWAIALQNMQLGELEIRAIRAVLLSEMCHCVTALRCCCCWPQRIQRTSKRAAICRTVLSVLNNTNNYFCRQMLDTCWLVLEG